MNMIYLDNAATTRMSSEVLETMMPFLTDYYGNPSSASSFSDGIRRAVQSARAEAARLINARPECIYFTSGGSESDNWALRGCASLMCSKGKHIIISSIEHHAVLNTAKYLEDHGFEITQLRPDREGLISAHALEAAIRPDTILVSVMMANNEIGTIEPIAELANTAHSHGILFHTDGVQAVGHLPIDVNRQHIDLLSASSHKLGGPKGTGFLYIRSPLRLPPLIYGGMQENGMRAGTENVPGIIGFGTASRIARLSLQHNLRYETALRNYLISGLMNIPHCHLNGSRHQRLPGNISICFDNISQSLIPMLDRFQICAASGAACSSHDATPSHVLREIGLSDDMAKSTIRFSLNHYNTKKELDTVISALSEITSQLTDNIR